MPTSISGALAQKVADAFLNLSATDQRIAVGQVCHFLCLTHCPLLEMEP